MFVYIITLLDSPRLAASSVLSELSYLLQRFNLFIYHLASLKTTSKISENYFGELRKTSENFGKLRKTRRLAASSVLSELSYLYCNVLIYLFTI